MPPTSRPSTRASRGRASASTSTTTSRPLHRHAGEEGQGRRAQGRAEERRRAAARHRPRPRGRGHRLAPARHAQAQGAGPPDGVPRDHRARHPRGRREPARPRPRPRRRPGDPPHPRPPLRLRGLAGAVEEGHAEAVGGPGAVGRHADHRAARARADGVRRRAAYWDIAATLDAGADATPRTFPARLVAVDGDRVATGRDFGPDGQLRGDVRACSTRQRAPARGGAATAATWPSTSVESKPYTRKPYAPFMTSTLQQEAGRKLRFSADRTMRSAPAAVRERLHHLHAHRLDHAVRVGDRRRPRAGARALRRRLRARPARGSTRARSRTRRRPTRPSGPPGRRSARPAQVAARARRRRLPALRADLAAHGRLADGRRPRHHRQRADRRARRAPARQCTFAASGRTITFPGFLKAYVETVDDQAATARPTTPSRRLPELTQGQPLTADSLTPDGHTTNPPARYTEASLVKALEDLGIGRPSTYASIIKTIQDRGYVWKKGAALVPSWMAFAVVGLLEHHFGRLVDYDFTAAMEDELDSIASGNQQRTDWLSAFYFGGAAGQRGIGGALGRAEEARRRQPRGDRRPRDQLHPDVRRRRGAGRALRAVPGAGARRRVAAREPARRPAARRADARARRAAVQRARRRAARWAPTR